MKNSISAVVISIYFLFSSYSVAATWTGSVSIDRVYVNRKNEIYIMPVGRINPDGCISDQYYRIDINHPSQDRWFTLATAALASGTRLSFGLEGCLGSYPKVEYLMLKRQ